MNLSDLTNLPLSALAAYCAGVLGLVLLLSALGVPLPSTLFVVAAGAFIQQGVLNLSTTIALSLVCVVLGDMLSYGMGRVLSRSMNARYGQSAAWRRAREYFARRGGLAIVLSRCVLTPIAVPVNLVAGSSAYSAWRFAAYDISGELIWLLGYGAIGYLFGSQWASISAFISHASEPLVGVLIAGGGTCALIRWQHHRITGQLVPAERSIQKSILPRDIPESLVRVPKK
jgi:membrane protein DedA with SNARE-associated domain